MPRWQVELTLCMVYDYFIFLSVIRKFSDRCFATFLEKITHLCFFYAKFCFGDCYGRVIELYLQDVPKNSDRHFIFPLRFSFEVVNGFRYISHWIYPDHLSCLLYGDTKSTIKAAISTHILIYGITENSTKFSNATVEVPF